MKFLFFIYLLTVSHIVNAQDKYVGNYNDYFASNLVLHSNHTFSYNWRFDLMSSWTNGTWQAVNDSIYFTMIPVYDTMKYMYHNAVFDSLVLSVDEKSELITPQQNMENISLSGGQNTQPYPLKLFYRKDRLFEINKNGKLSKKRVKGWCTRRKFPAGYLKVSTIKSSNY